MRNKKRLALLTTLILLTTSFPSLSFAHSKYYLQVFGGGGFAHVGKTQNITLSPGIVNRYVANRNAKGVGLIGLGVGRRFALSKQAAVALALSGYFMGWSHASGLVRPLWSINPNFATLNYQYSIHSWLLLLESRWSLTHWSWQPYLLVGAGIAWNRVYDYSETPTNPAGSAAPMPAPFGDRTTSRFAYEFGIGVKHRLNKKAALLVEYRYLNAGSAQLNTTPIQTTAQRISTGHLAANLLVISLVFSA